MIKSGFFSTFICLVVTSFFSCSDKTSGKTSITIINGGENMDVVLSQYHPFNLEQNILGKGSVASGQSERFEIELKDPSFIYYKAGNLYGGLLLEPGDDLTLNLPQRKFSGKGRAANEFIIGTHEVFARFNIRDLIYRGSSPLSFQERMDSLQHQLNAYREGYFDTANISKRAENLLAGFHKYLMLTHYQYFGMMNDVDRTRSVGLQSLRAHVSELPLDDHMENALMVEYGTALQLYSELEIAKKIARSISDEQRMNNPDKFLKMEIDTVLLSHRYPPAVKELFVARLIDNEIAMNGITRLVDSLFVDYKKRFPGKKYASLVQNRYDKWMSIAPGKPAPNFTGVTAEGDSIKLTDLRGKVVYIDVWATWCMPCIAEFPSSIALRQKFEQNKNLVFMFVSIDNDAGAWKRFLTNNSNLQGIHVIDQNSSVAESYLMRGIPRYMLIGADGKIINADAPRPSSTEIEQLIRQYLTN